jgi:hypothetical protein
VGDDNFIKLYVCLHNKWNPYSDEVKAMPTHYWLTTFYMLRQQPMINWKEALEPQAELIGNLIKPEIYQEYKKIKDRREKAKKRAKEGQFAESIDQGGLSGYAEADTYYDPSKGLMNSKGKVLIPKEEYMKMMHLDGFAISM